jgi:hypothetical protein
MLVINVCVNDYQIDQVMIQRTEPLQTNQKIYEYKIRHPKGYDLPIHHAYNDGWSVLTEKALKYINDREPIIKEDE